MTTAKKVVKPNPVHFVIDISLDQERGGPLYVVARNVPTELHRGDTVSYLSSDGQVTVKFDERDQDNPKSTHTSPYVDTNKKDFKTVLGGEFVKVSNRGKYLGKCFLTITMPDGTKKTIGWKKEKPTETKDLGPKPDSSEEKSGANHVVK